MNGLDTAFACCRFIHYASALFMFGTLALVALASPTLRSALDGLRWRVTVASVIAALSTSAFWLILQAAEAGGDWSAGVNPSLLGTVLTATDFGRLWLWHLLLALALAGAVLMPRRPCWPAATVVAALYLGSLAFVGHAQMLSGVAGWELRLSHVGHLLAAGYWLGALPALIVSVRLLSDDRLGADAMGLLQRFSGIGQLAVLVIVVSGAVNAVLILGGPPVAGASPYKTLLVVKIALVGLMVGLAAVNRYVLVPRLRETKAAGMLRLSIAAELAIGFVVVALVSVFGALSPLG